MLVAGVVLGVLMGPAVLGRLAPQVYDPLFENTGDLSPVQDARDVLTRLDTGEINIAQTDRGKQAFEAYEQANQKRQERIDAIREKYKLVGDEGDSTTIARDEQISAVEAEKELDQARLRQQLMNIKQDIRDGLVFNIAQAEQAVMKRREAHHDKLLGMATAMLLLIVLLFAAESILSPQRSEIESGKAVVPPMLSRLVTVRYALAAGWLMLMLAQPVWLRGIELWFGGLLLVVVLLAGLVPLGKRA